MPKFSKESFEVTQWLGARVGKDNPFMRKIACMTPEWRELMALLEILKITCSDDKQLIKDIDEILTPICEKMGQAEWNPDVITHLSMKLGNEEDSYDAE